MLKVYLTNLGKYNEGCLMGEWVSLPITFADFVDVLERIGIDGARYQETFISDYDCDIDGLTEHLGEYESIEALNCLAGVLDDLSDYQLPMLQAALAYGEHTGTVYELIELVRCLDAFLFYPDIDTDEDLGRYWIEEAGAFDVSTLGTLANYIDYDAFGRDFRLEEGGVHTQWGYISLIDDPWCPFDIEDVPEEYRLRPTEEI